MGSYEIRQVAASSHLDQHNMVIAKSALEDMVEQINGEYALSVGVEHDPTFPPAGKTKDAVLEPTEDGEWRVLVTQEVFVGAVELELPGGTKLWMQESETDKRPFSVAKEDFGDNLIVSVDPMNFATPEDHQSFLEALRTSAEFTDTTYFRKSLISDPQVIISLGTLLGGYFWARVGKPAVEHAAGPLSHQIGEDLAKLYSLLKSAVASAAKLAVPRNRPHTYIAKMPGEPIVDFVARTADADLLVTALQADRIAVALEEAKNLRETFDATNVQFEMSPNGDWRFNYLLTSTGSVIGVPVKFKERDQQLALILDKAIERHKGG